MLDNFLGQTKATEQLRIEIANGHPLPHMLILGPPGSGKTTLARSVASELDVPFEVLHCPNVKDRDAVTDKVLKAQGGILFCEEIHALRRDFAEDLYTVIDRNEVTIDWEITEPGKVPAVVEYEDDSIDLEMIEGEVPTGRYQKVNHPIDSLTIIGATTDEALLPEAFLSRLSGLVVRLREYDVRDLYDIAVRHAQDTHQMMLQAFPAAEIVGRSRGNPRRLLHLVDRAVSRAKQENLTVINAKLTYATFKALDVDEYGLEAPHRKMLSLLTSPVSRTTLAQQMGMPPKNSDMYFGELVRLGMATINRKHEITEYGRQAIRDQT